MRLLCNPCVFSGVTRAGVWNPACQIRLFVAGKPLPTDTILTIRCPHCVAGIDFSPMIAHKDGRFVCRNCAHTLRPGVREYMCTCRPCLRLLRKPLLTDHGSHLLTPTMTGETTKRWMEFATWATNEQDLENLIELVREINERLDAILPLLPAQGNCRLRLCLGNGIPSLFWEQWICIGS